LSEFSVRQGGNPQESFMDFKDWQRSMAVNPPKDGGRELLSTPSTEII